jgi:hypothetical protein
MALLLPPKASACLPPPGDLYGPFFYPWPGVIGDAPAVWTTTTDESIVLGTVKLYGPDNSNDNGEATTVNVTISIVDGSITEGWPADAVRTPPPQPPLVDPTGGYNFIVSTDGTNVTLIQTGDAPDEGKTIVLEWPSPYSPPSATSTTPNIFWFVDMAADIAYIFYEGVVNCTTVPVTADDRCDANCVTNQCVFADHFVSSMELSTSETIASGFPFESSYGLVLNQPGPMNSITTVWADELRIFQLGALDSCGNSGHLVYYPDDGIVEEMLRFDPGYLYATVGDESEPYVAYAIQQMEVSGEQRYVESFVLQKFHMVTGELIASTELDTDALWELAGLTIPAAEPVEPTTTTTPAPIQPAVPFAVPVPTPPIAVNGTGAPSTIIPRVVTMDQPSTAPSTEDEDGTAMPAGAVAGGVPAPPPGNATTTVTAAPPTSAPFAIMTATCTSNPACAALGLADDCCCPTPDGVMLKCCDVDSTVALNCPANPKCAAVDLEGACCPTEDGWYLDCCEVVPDTCGDDGNATTVTQCEVITVAEYKARKASAAAAAPWQWVTTSWIVGAIVLVMTA